jgi:RNA polymerase sigma-70 factor (family 1)
VSAPDLHKNKTLFMQISAGDEKAFRAIFDLYKVELFSVVTRLTKSQIIAEEIIQEVFISLWISREHLTKVEEPASYIYRIVFNRIGNYLKKEANQQRIIKASMQYRQSSSDLTEQVVAVNDTQRIITRALGQLPPQQRMVYRLSRQQGLNNNEIANQLHVSQHTVKSHLSKAIGFIRTYLQNTAVVVALLAGLINFL